MSTATESQVMLTRHAAMMGTRVSLHVTASATATNEADAALDACLDWLRLVERCLTRFDQSSELCQLNAAAGTWRAASDILFTVTEVALAAAAATDGLFDPCLLPLLEAYGYDRDFAQFAYDESLSGVAAPEVALVTPGATPGAWRDVRLDRDRQRIRLPEGVRLDFGGIAKGWAADEAIERFFGTFLGALVNLGGDMRASGTTPDGTPWPLGIGDPRAMGASTRKSALDEVPSETPPDEAEEQHLAVLTLGRGGLATSGAAARWWLQRGAVRHHVLDPRTGRPADIWTSPRGVAADVRADRFVIASASALAPTAAAAEVAAKVALLRGYPAALRAVDDAWDEHLARRGAGNTAPTVRSNSSGFSDSATALLLVRGDGQVICSKNMRAYLATCGEGGELWLS